MSEHGQVIPAQAVKAALYAYRVDRRNTHEWERNMIIGILEAAAPHMESERVEALKHELSLAQVALRRITRPTP